MTRKPANLQRGLVPLACALPLLMACAHAESAGWETLHSAGNPILADGRDYTTDPAPLVADGKLYILTGRDTAAPGVNDFIMPEWQMLETEDPASGVWRYNPHFMRPEAVFKWAAPARAYAAQIVQGPDRRYYMYAPVVEADSRNTDAFAIGVAVSDSPEGPWVDAHPSGPIVSQSVPVANNIQNIDPTVLVDDDGRVYLYWGTFGRLKGVELEQDMVTFMGATGRYPRPDRLLRGGLAVQAQGRLLPDVRRQYRRAGVRLHRGGLLCLPGLWYGVFAARPVDLSGCAARSGVLDHLAWRHRAI